MGKDYVAPHVGAWIEINESSNSQVIRYVAPHVGAWIEMIMTLPKRPLILSHPTWVRGLK